MLRTFNTIAFLAIQSILFTSMYLYFNTTPAYTCLCKKYQTPFPAAKTSATLISFNTMVLILSKIKTPYYYFPPIRSLAHIHTVAATCLVVWSCLHSFFHYINFLKLGSLSNLFSWNAGFTGHILLICIVTLCSTSIPYIREFLFHKFFVCHIFISSIFVTFNFIHQQSCTFKTTYNTCSFPTFWIWASPALVIYLAENIIKYLTKPFCPSHSQLKLHHGRVLEITVPIEETHAGKSIFVCCPSISPFEWHPFVVTCSSGSSSGSDKNACSIFVKQSGNWTSKLHRKYQIPFTLRSTSLLIQGPFYSLPLPHKLLNHQPTVWISTGLGIVSFTHILHYLTRKPQTTNTKQPLVCFCIIVKSLLHIDWLLSLFLELQNHPNIQLYLYVTEANESTTKLRAKTLRIIYKKPLFHDLLSSISLINNFHLHPRISVYFSGSGPISKDIKNQCKQFPQFKLTIV